MCRPLQTIKRKGGGTSLLKERLLKQSQESSYHPTRLRSNILAFYLSFWEETWGTQARMGVSQSAGEYFSTTGIRLISHFKPLHLWGPVVTATRSWWRRGRRELRRHQSNALCWLLEEADSNECLHNCSLSCSTPADHMCFRSWLINKHFSRYGCLPPGDLLLHLFSLLLSPAKKNSSPYDYVKLCLWKHTSAPLSHSPSPERAWLNCAFCRGGWRTALIGARCVPTSRRGNVFGQSSSSRS